MASSDSGAGAQDDPLSSEKLRKTALEILGWSSEETRFPLEGKVLFSQPANDDANWKKVCGATPVKMTSIQGLVDISTPENISTHDFSTPH